MNGPTQKISIYALLLGLILGGGCVRLERAYPDRRYFVVEAPIVAGSPNPDPAPTGVLLVTNLRVSPRYESKSFVYRISDSGFESDYYNQFLVSPGAMLTEDIRRGLAQVQAAQYVVGTSSQLDPTHVLEGTVDAFYGDFRDPNGPKARLDMEFFLSKESASRADILMRKRYSQSIAINGRSAEALVNGWSRALSEIITALAIELRAAKY